MEHNDKRTLMKVISLARKYWLDNRGPAKVLLDGAVIGSIRQGTTYLIPVTPLTAKRVWQKERQHNGILVGVFCCRDTGRFDATGRPVPTIDTYLFHAETDNDDLNRGACKMLRDAALAEYARQCLDMSVGPIDMGQVTPMKEMPMSSMLGFDEEGNLTFDPVLGKVQ